MIDFLDECIAKLSSDDEKVGVALSADRQDLLQRLVEKRRQAELSRKPKKQAPLPPSFGTSSPSKEALTSVVANTPDGDVSSSSGNASHTVSKTSHSIENDRIEPQLQQPQQAPNSRHGPRNEQSARQFPRQTSSETVQRVEPEVQEPRKSPSHSTVRQSPNTSPVKSNSSSSCEIDSRAAYHLLDEVRRNTQLSYDMSKLAVTVVVSGLQQLFPSGMSHYFEAVLNQLHTPLAISKSSIEETYDANRLKVIFTELTSCKQDSQQRSWMLYEDESIIVEYIKELTSILVSYIATLSIWPLAGTSLFDLR